jgi:hypothetical protein
VSEPPASEPVAASQPRLLDRLRTLASRRPVADRRQRIRGEHVAVAYGVVAVAGLIVLRALVDGLDFLSIGWILVLAALPLLPWLLPRLGVFLKEISPYVQTLKLGLLEIDLRSVRREPIVVPSSGIFASLPYDVAALSSGTAISDLVESLRKFRREGAGPVVIIDLKDGRKWRLPNLYFLVRLLEIEPLLVEPLVSELVFTEIRGGSDGYLVGSCSREEFRRQIEQTVPSYAAASRSLHLPSDGDLADPQRAQELGNEFLAFLGALAQDSGAEDDPVHGWVTSERIRTILAGLLSTAAIEVVPGTLRDEDVRTILGSPYRFVPATTGGRVTGLIDRQAVALVAARAAVARA